MLKKKTPSMLPHHIVNLEPLNRSVLVKKILVLLPQKLAGLSEEGFPRDTVENIVANLSKISSKA